MNATYKMTQNAYIKSTHLYNTKFSRFMHGGMGIHRFKTHSMGSESEKDTKRNSGQKRNHINEIFHIYFSLKRYVSSVQTIVKGSISLDGPWLVSGIHRRARIHHLAILYLNLKN